jgi:REP element-mobilizing transposase RayT
MKREKLRIKRRHLPHWTMKDATYFVTFNSIRGNLSIDCQLVTLNIIKEGNNKYYKLTACIVMPNHVHLILRPNEEYTLTRIMKGMKGKSARAVNIISSKSGSVWQDESHDRIIRCKKELMNKIRYIINNPVKKGLTLDPLNYHGLYLNDEICKSDIPV